jgi:hypothetical protein
MPATSAQGALGLRGKHIWTPTGGVAVTLNDLTAWPRYRLQWPIRGLHSLPESDDNREPVTEGIGEIVYDGYARGKTVTYQGFIFGQTEEQMREGGQVLRTRFGADITTGKLVPGRMVIEPHATYGGVKHTYTAQCRLCDIEEERPPSPTRQPSPYFSHFTIDLRLADPRLYEWDGAVASAAKW